MHVKDSRRPRGIRLLDLLPPARSRIIVPGRFPSADPHEPWTAGKVLRRLAEHEFEHLRATGDWRPMSA